MIRRAFLIFIAFFAVNWGTQAQGYYCDRQGARLEYVRKNIKDGSTEWRHTVNVKEVTKGSDGTKVTSVSTFLKANGKPYYKGDIIGNGSFSMGIVPTQQGGIALAFNF